MDVDFREEMNARLNEEQARVEIMIAEHKSETRDIQRELNAKMDLLLQTVSAKLDQQTAMLVRWVAGTMIGGFAVMVAIVINMLHETNLRIDDVRHQVEQTQHQMDGRFDGLQHQMDGRFDGLQHQMDERFDGLQHQLDVRIDGVQRQIEQLKNSDELRRIEQLEQRMERVDRPRGPPRASGQAE